MKHADLYVAIQSATEIIKQDEVLVIGSQSILASFDENELPERATASNEVDIAPLRDDAAEMIATLLHVSIGEWPDFDAANGFYVQGVSVRTAYLPEGWADRLVRVIRCRRRRGAPASALDVHADAGIG